MYCPSGKPVSEYIDDLRRMFPYIECDIGRPTMDYLKWEDAVITGDIDSCALGLPGEVIQRIPFMEGDVANYKGCLWESLVNNNITEPTLKNQRDGLWLNKCSLIDAINCLFPVEDNASCEEGCDEVKALPTLCERVTELENNPDKDMYISDFKRSGNTLTITRSDGETFSLTIPKELHVTGFAKSGNKLTVTRSDGTKYTVVLDDASSGCSCKGITRRTGSATVNDPAPGSSAEGTVLTAYTVPSSGIVDITATVEMVVRCNSASPSAAIDGALALFVGGTNSTGWVNIARVSRYNPAAVITKRQSTAIRLTISATAGQKIYLKVRNTTIVERGNHVVFNGRTDGMFYTN